MIQLPDSFRFDPVTDVSSFVTKGVDFLRNHSLSSSYQIQPPPGHTCNVDGVDEERWDFVPDIHQAGRVDYNVDPSGGLQHAVVICDVSLD